MASGSSKSSRSASQESSASKREEHRERLRRQRQAELARQRRMRTLVISAIVVLALLVAGGIGYGIYASRRSASEPEAVVPPTGLTAQDASYTLGAAEGSGKPVVDLYVDFMCPACGQFHQINGADLDAVIAAKSATVRLHTRTFLDSYSTTGDYSTRAANALACVADEKPERIQAMQDLLFESQPEENSPGLDNATLTSLAKQAGAGESVSSCISSERHVGWLHRVVEPEAQRTTGKNGTPYVAINGTRFTSWNQPGALKKAIASAGPGPSPSPAASSASDGGR